MGDKYPHTPTRYEIKSWTNKQTHTYLVPIKIMEHMHTQNSEGEKKKKKKKKKKKEKKKNKKKKLPGRT